MLYHMNHGYCDATNMQSVRGEHRDCADQASTRGFDPLATHVVADDLAKVDSATPDQRLRD